MAEEVPSEKPAPAAPTPSKGGGKLVTILTLVNLLICLGMGAVLFISFNHEKNQVTVDDLDSESEVIPDAAPEDSTAQKPKETTKMLPLELFTVNLSSPGGATPKFVRVNISLEVLTDEVANEVNSKMPQVRNAIIDLFNSKRSADLATSESRNLLKNEIKNSINSFMNQGKIKGVYFTNFAITS